MGKLLGDVDESATGSLNLLLDQVAAEALAEARPHDLYEIEKLSAPLHGNPEVANAAYWIRTHATSRLLKEWPSGENVDRHLDVLRKALPQSGLRASG